MSKYNKYIVPIKILNHTPNTFCQGLVYYDNILYESSGLFGSSFIQKYLDNDRVVRKKLPDNVFAEGICILNNILYCLTWVKSELFAFDLDFKLIYCKKFILDTCWGFGTDGKYFIVSDGSNKIYWIDPVTFNYVRIIDTKIHGLNALTYHNEKIYVNQFMSNLIVKIDLTDIDNITTYNLDKIMKLESNAETYFNVPNGIAYIENSDNLFYITGKNWDKIYLVKLD